MQNVKRQRRAAEKARINRAIKGSRSDTVRMQHAVAQAHGFRGMMKQAYRPIRRWFARVNRLPHQGKQETARRRSQIRRGILTDANGLVVDA